VELRRRRRRDRIGWAAATGQGRGGGRAGGPWLSSRRLYHRGTCSCVVNSMLESGFVDSLVRPLARSEESEPLAAGASIFQL
jgi:hypothetical protein